MSFDILECQKSF